MTEDELGHRPQVVLPEDWEEAAPEERARLAWAFQGFQSPLLPPEVLARYGNVIPGLDKKLVEWAEEETRHRREIEREAFEDERKLRNRGAWTGPLVAVFGLFVAAVVSIMNEHGTGAFVAATIAIVSVGGPFAARLLAGRRASTDDRDE